MLLTDIKSQSTVQRVKTRNTYSKIKQKIETQSMAKKKKHVKKRIKNIIIQIVKK